MGKVSFKRDIDSQIARLRSDGYKQAKKIPRGLTGDKNRRFVKSFSGMLNIYAIINEYGRVYYHFDLQKKPFQKMIEELEAVSELYKKYNKRVRPYFRKYEGKLIGQKETQGIFTLTRKNERLMEKAGRKHLEFLRKYRDFYELCVRFTSAPDVGFLFSFRLGPTMKKTDRSLFFKFFDAVLENHSVYVKMAGRPKGSGVRYNPDVVELVKRSYKKRKPDCREIWNEIDNCSSPRAKARELAWKFKLPLPLIEKVIEGRTTTLTNFILSAVYYDVFRTTENQHLEYLRKMLRTKNPTRN